MTINPINNAHTPLQPQLKAADKGAVQPLPKEEALEKTQDVLKQQEFVSKLVAMDSVRPDVVAAGKELLNNPSFPSVDDLDQLAKALLSPIESEE